MASTRREECKLMSGAAIRRFALVLALAVCGSVISRARAAPPLAPEAASLPDIVSPLLGAVVNILVHKPPSPDGTAAEPNPASSEQQDTLGSGFIIDPDGYVVTNRHVVAGGSSVIVTLSDNRQIPARVLATNLYPDLALLKIDAGRPLPSVHFGNSDALRLGETVFAIGNPLGLSSSISAGVVSALNRNISSTVIDDFIQTDASINHGNSGGPLFDLRGEVVGVNWALISDTRGSIGLGLAIPSNDVALVVNSMRRFGRLIVGFPGMLLQAVTPALASSLGLSGTAGGIVTEVLPGGPADKAGIEVGDVVLQLGSERTRDVRALLRQFAGYAPGSVGTFEIWRAGRTSTVNLTFTSFPAEYDPVGPPAMADRGPRVTSPPLGLRLVAISEDARKTYGLATEQRGVVVANVADNSAGADAGLARGDVIELVQDAKVTSPDEVVACLEKSRAEGHETVPMLVRSGGRLQWMAIPIREL